NSSNSTAGDLVFGQVDLYDSDATLVTATPSLYNGVRLKVRRDSMLNGEAPFFFARIFGLTSQGLGAEATAGYLRNIGGVQITQNGGNLDVLPYSLDWNSWEALPAGNATDQWRWNAATQTITPGADGVKEVNLFPQ